MTAAVRGGDPPCGTGPGLRTTSTEPPAKAGGSLLSCPRAICFGPAAHAITLDSPHRCVYVSFCVAATLGFALVHAGVPAARRIDGSRDAIAPRSVLRRGVTYDGRPSDRGRPHPSRGRAARSQ